MVNWLRNFWYHDTIDEMQRKMLQSVWRKRTRTLFWVPLGDSGNWIVSTGARISWVAC